MPLDHNEPKVILLGLPNVGKSALFNALVQRRAALVFDRPGVTRDCRYERFALDDDGSVFATLVDTPGVLPEYTGRFSNSKDSPLVQKGRFELDELTSKLTLGALKSADVVLFLFDGKQEQQAALSFFNSARKYGKPMIPVVNKCDALRHHAVPDDLHSIGQDLLLVSAAHRQGLDELKQAILHTLPFSNIRTDGALPLLTPLEKISFQSADGTHSTSHNLEMTTLIKTVESRGNSLLVDPTRPKSARDLTREEGLNQPLTLAIVGRPNVGKSTLINALLGRQQQLVANCPGVTRDSIELEWTYRSRLFRLCDTAGIRRRSRIHDPLEKITVSTALRCARAADVCVLVLDAVDIESSDFGELLQQDLLLADKILQEGRCVILALNKWDLVRDRNLLRKKFLHSLSFAAHLKDVFWSPLSAEKKKGLSDLLSLVLQVEDSWRRHFSTAKLNSWLRDLVAACPPPTAGFRPSKLKYMTQVGNRPPHFIIFGTRMETVPESYRRFVQSRLREAFDLHGVPVLIQWRQQDNPYVSRQALDEGAPLKNRGQRRSSRSSAMRS